MADLLAYRCSCGCRCFLVLSDPDDDEGYLSADKEEWSLEATAGAKLKRLYGEEADQLIASFIAWKLVNG